jgi:hypothetical protein
LKLKSLDNKTRMTDVLNSEQVVQLAKKIPNSKANNFLE